MWVLPLVRLISIQVLPSFYQPTKGISPKSTRLFTASIEAFVNIAFALRLTVAPAVAVHNLLSQSEAQKSLTKLYPAERLRCHRHGL